MSSTLLEKRGSIKLFNASVSKVKTFDEDAGGCKKKYKFAYIERLPKKTQPFHIFGKYLHLTLELFHKELLKNPFQDYSELMSLSQDKALETWGNKLTIEQKKEAYEIVNTYLLKLSGHKENGTLPNFIDMEREFFINIDDKVLLNGVIDLFQKDIDGIYHVADYKTSKKEKYLKKDSFQLLVYAFYVKLLFPEVEKVRGSYIMLKHNCNTIDFEFSLKDIMKIENKFLKYAEEIQNEKLFRPKTSPLCEYCDAFKVKDKETGLPLCKEGDDFIAMMEKNKAKKKENNGPKYGESDW